MDEQEQEPKQNTVDELVKDLTSERDKYKTLYEKERDAHAATLRRKLLTGDADDDEDAPMDEDESAAETLRKKYEKRR